MSIRRVIRSVSVFLLIGMASSAVVIAAQAVIKLGPVTTTSTYYEIGRGSGMHKFHFYAQKVNGDFTPSAIAAKARSAAATRKTDGTKSHIWDDRWYYRTLSPSGNEYLLCFWHNRNTDEIGWAAVKNSPTVWTIKTSQSKTFTPGNESQVKVRYNVTNTNQILDIDFYNPQNNGGWTSNDIWYGFGF